jgi:hypothetical protein
MLITSPQTRPLKTRGFRTTMTPGPGPISVTYSAPIHKIALLHKLSITEVCEAQ